MQKAISTSILVWSFLLFAGCGSSFERKWEEIARIENPKVEIDAVIYRTNAGAMSSYEYHLFAVPRGKGKSDGIEMLFAEFIAPDGIVWTDEETITVNSGGVKYIGRLRFMDYVEIQKRVRLVIQDMPAI